MDVRQHTEVQKLRERKTVVMTAIPSKVCICWEWLYAELCEEMVFMQSQTLSPWITVAPEPPTLDFKNAESCQVVSILVVVLDMGIIQFFS